MGALEIILLIAVIILIVIAVMIHFDRKKTHAVYQFMADMVSEEGGALQQALEDLKATSKYADPAESAAAIGEIIRFLDSFNTTVRKQAERIEEHERNKLHRLALGLFKKKKKVDYSALLKKKTEEKKEPEEKKEEKDEKDTELERIEEKIQSKLTEPDSVEVKEETEKKPAQDAGPKKVKKLRRRLKKRVKPGAPNKTGGEAPGHKPPGEPEKHAPGDTDTDIDLPPPPESE
jgi:hypothetical protein